MEREEGMEGGVGLTVRISIEREQEAGGYYFGEGGCDKGKMRSQYSPGCMSLDLTAKLDKCGSKHFQCCCHRVVVYHPNAYISRAWWGWGRSIPFMMRFILSAALFLQRSISCRFTCTTRARSRLSQKFSIFALLFSWSSFAFTMSSSQECIDLKFVEASSLIIYYL